MAEYPYHMATEAHGLMKGYLIILELNIICIAIAPLYGPQYSWLTAYTHVKCPQNSLIAVKNCTPRSQEYLSSKFLQEASKAMHRSFKTCCVCYHLGIVNLLLSK